MTVDRWQGDVRVGRMQAGTAGMYVLALALAGRVAWGMGQLRRSVIMVWKGRWWLAFPVLAD